MTSLTRSPAGQGGVPFTSSMAAQEAVTGQDLPMKNGLSLSQEDKLSATKSMSGESLADHSGRGGGVF